MTAIFLIYVFQHHSTFKTMCDKDICKNWMKLKYSQPYALSFYNLNISKIHRRNKKTFFINRTKLHICTKLISFRRFGYKALIPPPHPSLWPTYYQNTKLFAAIFLFHIIITRNWRCLLTRNLGNVFKTKIHNKHLRNLPYSISHR